MTAVAAEACYVFGIVPADDPVPAVEDNGLATGVRVIRHRSLGAVVASTPLDRALGTADDLLAHDRVLTAIAHSGTPVLPMRFGAVLSDDDAVSAELLEPHHDDFVADLERVRGCLQYTMTVRYEQEAILREVLGDHPELERLQQRSRGDSEGAFRVKLQLGSAIVSALAERRTADAAEVLVQVVHQVEARVHEPANPEVVLQSSFLVRSEDFDSFEHGVELLGRSQSGRLRIRLVGPSPAYDFVGGD